MHIFEPLFGEKPTIPVEQTGDVATDLILDWLNTSGLNYQVFKNTFFEPARTLIQPQPYLEELYVNVPEQLEKDYHTWLIFAYLVYHYPDNALMRRLFNGMFNQQIPQHVRSWLCSGWQSGYDFSKPMNGAFTQVHIAAQLIQCYQAIHVRADNISDLNYVIMHLTNRKFSTTYPDTHEELTPYYFEKVFYYVKNQSFKEKLHVFFKTWIGTKTLYHLVQNEQGESVVGSTELITTSPQDAVVQAAFI